MGGTKLIHPVPIFCILLWQATGSKIPLWYATWWYFLAIVAGFYRTYHGRS